MSVIIFLKWAIGIINSHMSKFFWNDLEEKHNYHLSNWGSLCLKEFGGLGIPNLKDINMCLLSYWVQRFYSSDDRLWKEILSCKYQLYKPNIFCCKSRNASPFFKGSLWAAQAVKMGYM
jgi:hypothetical protein